jgi:hypothetical protein
MTKKKFDGPSFLKDLNALGELLQSAPLEAFVDRNPATREQSAKQLSEHIEKLKEIQRYLLLPPPLLPPP